MEFRTVRALRGPNLWSLKTVLEAVWKIDDLPDAAAGPRVLAALQRALPGLAPSAVPGSAPFWPDLLRALILEIQRAAGVPVAFTQLHGPTASGLYRIIVEYREEEVGRTAIDVALALAQAALDDAAYDLAAALKSLRARDEHIRLGPSTGSIVQAAHARGIPYRRLNTGSLVQFGYGKKQRRILAAETDRTGAIAEMIAQDKELTKSLLHAAGVPVPIGRPATSPEDAVDAAREIGFPVVVKPQFGNQGRGVAVNLRTEEQVIAAFHAAKEEGTAILVEKFAPGFDHRVLVIGDEVIAAAHRQPPFVVGDGVHTIAWLVEETNKDPRRGEDHATSLSKLKLDDIGRAVLAEQGLTVDSIPQKDVVVPIRRNANLSTGGSAIDVTETLHPDVAARCVDAARIVGLDIAGIDIVALDLSRPLEDQGAVIVEINAAPGLRMHLEPSVGRGRPVGEAIAKLLYPDGDNGRIPVIAVTGVNGKTTTCRCIGHIFKTAGHTVGMTSTTGIYVNGRQIDGGDCSGPKSARAVLAHPQVDAAILETARGGILREGLGFEECDVAVVTNIGEGDHLGINDIDTLDQLAEVKQVIVRAVSKDGWAVLNAADPYVVKMAAHCPGRVAYFALDAQNAVIAAHRQVGGRAVYTRGEAIFLAEGSRETWLAALVDIPCTHHGRVAFQVENVLASVAAAWCSGIPAETLVDALLSFRSDADVNPARFNVLEAQGATVVIDYGHNTSALKALIDALDRFPAKRRACLYTAAGDRRDNDIIDQAKLLAMAFDDLVIYEDQCTRGRADGEVIALMRQGLVKGGRVQRIHETRGELVAMEYALNELRAGDVLLIQADQIDIAIKFIKEWLATHSVPGQPPARNPDRNSPSRTLAASRPEPLIVGAACVSVSAFLGDGENDEDSCVEERACRAMP